MDRGFIALLFLASATGLALLAWRDSGAMALWLAIHLGVVMALFLTLPYGKFAHGVFRSAALVKWAIEKRRPSALEARRRLTTSTDIGDPAMTTSGKLSIPSMKERCSAAEWNARVDLAACYRLVDLYGMSDMMANHISSHVPGEPGAFLINAYGMMYEEITASSLIKVDRSGTILSTPDFGELDYGINKAGYVIHSAVHAARPDVACVIHTHSWASMAVSSLECGLLPLTQTAMRFLKIGYHDYQGVVLDEREQASLLADLGERRGA